MSGQSSAQKIDCGIAQLKRRSPKGFALGLHIRFASALFMFQTYDPRWVEVYTTKGYMLVDPVISWGFGNVGIVRWSDFDHPDPHNIMCQAAEFGLKYGLAISHGPESSRSIGGFARADREFTDAEMGEISELVAQIHQEATPPEKLTAAQCIAMRMVASGSRYADAADRLGISESALKARLRSARDRLSARTTAEAIQRAREYKLL